MSCPRGEKVMDLADAIIATVNEPAIPVHRPGTEWLALASSLECGKRDREGSTSADYR